jgi:UDP-N-acetylglucosamine/UDP-N-acetylgalactosamine diphosphorylase
MDRLTEATFASLFDLLQAHRQEDVLRFWSELVPEQQQALARQINEIDLSQLAWLFSADESQAESPAQKSLRAQAPSQLVRARPRDDRERQAWAEARKTGKALLAAGRVGVILVAGGEGTRLGFPRPKGEFPIGAVSGKTLFQLLAEQVVARSQRAGKPIPYYVMTSEATHDATVEFFQRHRYFGLPGADVRFFRQGNMPAVDRASGRLLLSSKHELALNPDGHGGLLGALARANLLEDMRRRGVDFLYYHQVDNPLAQVCEPGFLGFHAERHSDVSMKVVAKLGPEERMGVVVDVDGTSQIIEYSDLPKEVAARRNEQGELLHWAGSTAIHIFSRSFLERVTIGQVALPFHRAVKKVPFIDDAGRVVEPAAENAIKFERFIFDVLPLAERSLVVEALREDEFCPLKNKTGDFSPDHVRAGMSRRFAGWLRLAGATVPDNLPVEINPLYALDAEELTARMKPPRNFDAPVYLEPSN